MKLLYLFTAIVLACAFDGAAQESKLKGPPVFPAEVRVERNVTFLPEGR